MAACETCSVPLPEQTGSGRRRRFCTHCGRERSRESANARRRTYGLRYSYGITEGDYDRMLAEQGGVCAICASPPTGARRPANRLNVDHDHSTGRVRGLLCTRCNTLLGLADEDPDRLAAAAAYLLEA